MYHLAKEKVDKLMTEAENISRQLLESGAVAPIDLREFGMALADVQLQVRNEQYKKEHKLLLFAD